MKDRAVIHLSWVRSNGFSFCVAYRYDHKRLYLEIVDYSIYLSKIKRYSPITVESEMYHVSVFMQFLEHEHRILSSVDDSLLLRFREYKLSDLTSKSSVFIRARKRTVNAMLRRVYLFLCWYQQCNPSHVGLIGPNGAVTCYLLQGGRGRANDFPLLLKVAGSSSRHRINFEATDEHLDQLRTYFVTRYSGYALHRNLLILEIANEVGLRRASINSITSDLVLDAVNRAGGIDDLWLIPPTQKFDYKKDFEFSFGLISNILSYINGPLSEFLKSSKVSPKSSRGHLILSSITGRPLTSRAITDIFSEALRGIGVSHGSIHGLRRKFTNQKIIEEIQRRVSLGLDTSVASVSASVSLLLGHANPDSIHPYVSAQIGRYIKLSLKEQKGEVARLEKQLEDARRKLAEMVERPTH